MQLIAAKLLNIVHIPEQRTTGGLHYTSITSLQEPHDPSAHLAGGRQGKIKSMVYKISKKVASAKIVQRAAQKVSSYPLVLTVVVKGLEGVLAVNIPPPPTDTIW